MGRVWYMYAPDREELFLEEQWCNMPDEAQDGQEGSEGQEEQEEETRAEREMREDLLHRAEEYGASGEVEGAQRAVVGRLGAAQTAREALVVRQEGPTAEEKKKDDLEKAAACRNRTEANRPAVQGASSGKAGGSKESQTGWKGRRRWSHKCCGSAARQGEAGAARAAIIVCTQCMIRRWRQ